MSLAGDAWRVQILWHHAICWGSSWCFSFHPCHLCLPTIWARLRIDKLSPPTRVGRWYIQIIRGALECLWSISFAEWDFFGIWDVTRFTLAICFKYLFWTPCLTKESRFTLNLSTWGKDAKLYQGYQHGAALVKLHGNAEVQFPWSLHRNRVVRYNCTVDSRWLEPSSESEKSSSYREFEVDNQK